MGGGKEGESGGEGWGGEGGIAEFSTCMHPPLPDVVPVWLFARCEGEGEREGEGEGEGGKRGRERKRERGR